MNPRERGKEADSLQKVKLHHINNNASLKGFIADLHNQLNYPISMQPIVFGSVDCTVQQFNK